MRVGILGMAGRMGRLLIEEVRSAGHEVVGGTLNPASTTTTPDDVPLRSLRQLVHSADAVIDFTHASAFRSHAAALAASRAIWVVGTTGLSREEEAELSNTAKRIPVMRAAHFGLGINILTVYARHLGALLTAQDYDAEIIEMHHRHKVDAPSGSAIVLGRAVAEGRGRTLEAVMDSGRDGQTGPRDIGAIGFASLRGGQIVGEHTLHFTSAHEQISLSHRVLDRRVFAVGAVRAMEWTQGKGPGLYSMEDVLGLKASEPQTQA